MHQAAKALGELCKVGAKVALLATRDGLLIESVAGQQPPPDLDYAAAGAASALEAAKLMVSGLTPACVQGVLVELKHGSIMTVHQIGDEMILAVLADTIGGLGRLLVELRRLIPVITAAVDAGTGDSSNDGVRPTRLDAPAKAENVHNTYVISPEVASPSGDQEETLPGPVPRISRHDVDGAVRGTKTGLPQATQPPEADAARAPDGSVPAGSALVADPGLSSSKETKPRSGDPRELASVPVPDLQGAATGFSVNRLLHQNADGARPDSVGAESGARSAATTRPEENVGMLLARVHLDVTGQVATATVEVTCQERRATGRAVGRNQPDRNLFLVAEATAQAVTKLLPPHHGVMVEPVRPFSSGPVEAWPQLVWLSPTDDGIPLQPARTDDRSPEGMANAVLHAVNDRLGTLLAEH